MNRRDFIAAGLISALAGLSRPAAALTPEAIRLEVFKSPSCGCCTAWLQHMSEAGFQIVARNVDQDMLWQVKADAGVPLALSSCHTGLIDGYFIEGHVPARDVRRLLAERPDALGLTVPGMPIGSPGMEMGAQRDAFDTLLIAKDGGTAIFSSHR